MKVNKNKGINAISHGRNSFKHQHSSLKVNLSCASYLTDSGNDSFEQIDVHSDIDNTVSYDTPLKNVSKHKHSKIKGSDKSIDLIEMDNINTVKMSLNVNTSIDCINDNNICGNKYRWENCEEEKYESSENKQTDMFVIGFETVQENINTTSLQMYTSLDILNKVQNDNNTIDDFPMNATRNNFDDEHSNIYKAQGQNNVILQNNHDSEYNGIVSNTIAVSHSNSEMSTIIKESTGKCDIEIDQNMKYSLFDRKSKRKLLPLHERSQLLSFSPVEDKEYSPPPCLIFKKIHKKKKSKSNKTVNVNNPECIVKKNNKNHDGKTQKRTKKVISKKIVVKKIVNEDILRRLNKNQENLNKVKTANVYTPERNSSDDFQLLKNSPIVHFTKKKMYKLNIVTTGLSNENKDIVKNVVRTLGSAKIESNVTKNTTHIVTTGIRTINLLHGIIRGCWLVTFEWVSKSLENKAWLNPEKYEIVHCSKAALENRKDRQLFGRSYVPELFAACGYIYVQKNTTPSCNVLKNLIKAAGGCITECPEIARILIGVGGLKETWILDCITSGELQPHNQYKRS
ncbi:uncharacterized protein LOC126865464 [Bombus huntii]|uniref:uncharacterized protein LOC126865464 n=1 Tax=Bombus huntii TaxID=85661 RepID=UPI0021AA0F44|nr:uncharacterized protein LOC126865464 [Bombus huntii]XP_050473937.1 uncharacterized protein LOC126865464 [Bombus huntii]XP_050473938.1 uncharacterized protein LOC126865464 [Bombus huntii]XP_050473939.1 uncharacterized protein LOC126865464 [Bombus huntii]XP_050473940.1 uncharacterized protein LOC126865464 [Bombus huntii]